MTDRTGQDRPGPDPPPPKPTRREHSTEATQGRSLTHQCPGGTGALTVDR